MGTAMTSSGYPQEWAEYLDLVEQRHGKSARALAEKHGTAAAGDAAEIRRRQRTSWRSRMMARRGRR